MKTGNPYILSLLILTIGVALSPCSAGGVNKGDPKRGVKIFSAMTCDICHLHGGNMQNPDRPIKGAAFQKRYPDDVSLGQLIRKGISDKGMPAFGRDRMSDQDLADVIAYVRSLSPPLAAAKKKTK
ncbi:MAG: c-type cytochrome [Candidatus Obscuribacterales bacterium]|jgi:mono/diheme cytochrome c family protein|nr:c-type cytochrome [Candidatus Obscuribacterales bacterium]